VPSRPTIPRTMEKRTTCSAMCGHHLDRPTRLRREKTRIHVRAINILMSAPFFVDIGYALSFWTKPLLPAASMGQEGSIGQEVHRTHLSCNGQHSKQRRIGELLQEAVLFSRPSAPIMVHLYCRVGTCYDRCAVGAWQLSVHHIYRLSPNRHDNEVGPPSVLWNRRAKVDGLVAVVVEGEVEVAAVGADEAIRFLGCRMRAPCAHVAA